MLSVTPAAGSGASQTFSIQTTGSTGSTGIQEIDFITGVALNQTNSCWVEYWAPTKMLYLKSDNNLSWTQAAVGSGTVLSNSQCSVNTGSSGAYAMSNDVTLNLAISYNSSFAGTKSLFAFAEDTSGQSSGWVNAGTFGVN